MNLLQLKGIQTLKDNAWHTLKRFPLVLLNAFAGTLAALILVDNGLDDDSELLKALIRLLVGCSLGLSATLAAYLFAESRNWVSAKRHALAAGVWVLVGVYATLWFDPHPGVGDELLYRHFLFMLIAHLLVSVIGFTGVGSVSGFWQFNSQLFTSILLAALYTGTLWVGLSLGLVGVDKLLGLDVPDKTYAQVFVFLSGIFNTWFFLNHVPQLSEVEQDDETYPAELKVFTGFVLLPLNALYAVILYLYMFKIAVQGRLPEGYVTWLVQWFSVAGILALLLIWPLRHRKGQRWIQLYTKWFYRLLLPLIVLQFVAIGIRVAEYGLTIDRYFVIQLAVWLLAMALYFLFSKQKDIRIVPLSLAFVAFYSSFGPWGAFSASERNQRGRLIQLGETNQFIRNGQFVKRAKAPNPDDIKAVQSILNYLQQSHGVRSLQPLFTEKIDSAGNIEFYLIDTYQNTWLSQAKYQRSMTYTAYCQDHNLNDGLPLRLLGAEYLVVMELGGVSSLENPKPNLFRQKLTHRTLEVVLDTDSVGLHFRMENRKPLFVSLRPPTDSLLAQVNQGKKDSRRSAELAPGMMTVEGAGIGLRVRYLLQNVEFEKDGASVKLIRVRGLLLLDDGA